MAGVPGARVRSAGAVVTALLFASVVVLGWPGAAGAAGRYAVTNTIAVGSDPRGVAVDPLTHTAYVTNSSDDTVSVIDEASNTVTTTIDVGNFPVGVAVDPGTHTVYVANSGGRSVAVIDETSNTVTATIDVGGFPSAVAVDPGTHTVYVANAGGRSVAVIDETSNTVTTTIDVGSIPSAVAVDPSTHTVYVIMLRVNSVAVIDGTSNTVTTTIDVGATPFAVAVDPSTHTAYVTNQDGKSVSVIDGASNTVTSTMDFDNVPYGVAVDPGTHTAYVTTGTDRSVSVVDETSNTVITTIVVGFTPTDVAVDPSTHTAYVANYGSNSVSVVRAAAGQPTGVSAVAGSGQATVSFDAPTEGGAAITSYTVTSSPGAVTATCPDSPCTVTGLTNGTSYTFTVHATNDAGDSPESDPSDAVTPSAPPPPSAPPASATCSSFTDVPPTNSFCPDIAWLADHQITKGYPNGTFKPGRSVEREEVAAFLYRYAHPGRAATPCTTKPFTDVSISSPFCGDIAALKSQGVVAGYSDRGFRPGAAVSRQAASALLYRVANPGKTVTACTTAAFNDVPASSQFCGDINYLVGQKVTLGYSDGGFHPAADVTRQAMAAFLHRLYTATH